MEKQKTETTEDWNHEFIECVRSKGGVCAVADPFRNLIQTGVRPWPPPELIQKLYKSRQERAFEGEAHKTVMKKLGYYCDLQSLHSEDAITWSVFGTAARAPQSDLEVWLIDLLGQLELPEVKVDDAEIFLWRRIPHPDTLVSGGPEIDFGISTANALILGEAKWRSGIGAHQGKLGNKDQIQLRGEFLKKYAKEFFPGRSQFAVVGVGQSREAFVNTMPEGIAFRTITWEEICKRDSHPLADEVWRYYEWKKANSNPTRKKARW